MIFFSPDHKAGYFPGYGSVDYPKLRVNAPEKKWNTILSFWLSAYFHFGLFNPGFLGQMFHSDHLFFPTENSTTKQAAALFGSLASWLTRSGNLEEIEAGVCEVISHKAAEQKYTFV